MFLSNWRMLCSMLLWGLTSCFSGSSQEPLVVYAASSLTDALTDMEPSFEGLYPGIDVQLGLAGSQALRLQIEQGAPADVFFSANEEHIQALVQQGILSHEKVFAYNELVVIVRARARGDNGAMMTSESECLLEREQAE